MPDRDGRISIVEDRPDGKAEHLRMDASGRVTAFNGHVDLGTGIEVALAQIVAEELDLPLDAVTVVLGDTGRTPDQGPTIASETIQVAAVPLRQAAAQLARHLASDGARRLNAPADDVTLADGRVSWGGASVGYAALVAGQELELRLDPEVRLKSPADYSIVGTPAGRRDLPEKITGAFEYVHDIRIPGMLHGHVVRPPYEGRDSGDFIGKSLVSWDEAAVRDMPGFRGIVREGDFLAVVAETSAAPGALPRPCPFTGARPPRRPTCGT